MIYVHQHFTNDDFTSFFLASENTFFEITQIHANHFILMWIGQITKRTFTIVHA